MTAGPSEPHICHTETHNMINAKTTESTIGPKWEKQIQINKCKFRTVQDGRLDTLDRDLLDVSCLHGLKAKNKQQMTCDGCKLIHHQNNTSDQHWSKLVLNMSTIHLINTHTHTLNY